MIQQDLFDPTTWGVPLPIGPRVKRPWKKPAYVIEVRQQAVASPHIGPVDPHLPLGACCIYKITHIATGKSYIGKTVWPLEKYIKVIRRRKIGHIGRALRKYGRAAFRSEIILVGSEDFCFRDVIDGKRGGMERRLIAAYGTLKPGGYNLTPGGEGFTSEGMRRWHKTPEGRAANARCTETMARRAGYPQRRVLAELKKGPRSIDPMAASLGLTRVQVQSSFISLRRKGHYIIGEREGLFRLVILEEAADDWASGRALTDQGRVLGALMKGPRTRAELAATSGMPRDSVHRIIMYLRRNGYNIVRKSGGARGGGGRIPGTFRMIQDERHPWLHLGAMDLRGAVYDDRE